MQYSRLLPLFLIWILSDKINWFNNWLRRGGEPHDILSCNSGPVQRSWTSCSRTFVTWADLSNRQLRRNYCCTKVSFCRCQCTYAKLGQTGQARELSLLAKWKNNWSIILIPWLNMWILCIAAQRARGGSNSALVLLAEQTKIWRRSGDYFDWVVM